MAAGARACLLCGIALILLGSPVRAEEADPLPCGGTALTQARVLRVPDGRSLLLDDGREVRLAGIEVPLPTAPGREPPEGDASATAATAATAGLDALAAGDTVALREAAAGPDRYGRLVAYAYVLRDDDRLFVQGEMLAAGLARVGDRDFTRACLASLLEQEAAARAAKLGLWADPYYEVLHAETPADVLAHRGRFALVEGTVVSVRGSGATIYVNFGRRWSEGFTVTVPKRNERNFAAAGIDLNGLTGRRVRVRGFVESRGAGGTAGAPSIEAARPEQIETGGL